MDDIRSIVEYDIDLYRKLIELARRTPPGKKVAMGLRLFDSAYWLAMGLVHAENPELTEEECRQELSRRIEAQRQREREEDEAILRRMPVPIPIR